ncbi:hypothetical protein ATCC90586_003315 [Pythium insidiosum]|nr:hypothetical protein ATCC90586_003315 [Pythium insidiosum]
MTDSDCRKRHARDWDDMSMSAEVFETPDPEVTFQPYAAVAGGRASGAAVPPEEAHYFDKSNMELDEGTMAPNQAFEVFMGKVYKPPALLPSQTELQAPGANAAVASKPTASRDLESPLQRYTRLVMEVKELESDLSLLSANAAAAKQSNVLVDAAQDAEFSDIMQGLATLQLSLASMEKNTSFQPFLRAPGAPLPAGQADAVAAIQRDLTDKFFHQIDALKRQQQGRTSLAPTDNAGAPIVYEIYSNGELNPVDRDAKSRVLALESRLAALEKIIGAKNPRELHIDGIHASAAENADLVSVVEEMEKRVGLLNEKNLDAVKSRTTALVHELTLLQKLKDSPGVHGALNAQADREKLQQIYEKMLRVDDVAGSIPALIDRLTTLKSLHEDSMDLTERTRRMEQSQTRLQELLESDAALVANMEKSLEENVQVFQRNIQALDERMARLLGRP